jgi:hypothetical protein
MVRSNFSSRLSSSTPQVSSPRPTSILPRAPPASPAAVPYRSGLPRPAAPMTTPCHSGCRGSPPPTLAPLAAHGAESQEPARPRGRALTRWRSSPSPELTSPLHPHLPPLAGAHLPAPPASLASPRSSPPRITRPSLELTSSLSLAPPSLPVPALKLPVRRRRTRVGEAAPCAPAVGMPCARAPLRPVAGRPGLPMRRGCAATHPSGWWRGGHKD